MKHIQLIAHADGQSTAGATLAYHRGNNRRLQAGHDGKVEGDRFTLAAFFGPDTWIGTRSIDKGQDRHTETLSHFHQPQGLTIPFRARHTKIPLYLVAHLPAFLVPNHHDRLAIQAGCTTHDGLIVRITTVTVQLVEVVKDHVNVVEGIGPAGMTRQACHVPGFEVREDAFSQADTFLAQPADLVGDVDVGVVSHHAKLFNFGFKVGNRLFEIQIIRVHDVPSFACKARM